MTIIWLRGFLIFFNNIIIYLYKTFLTSLCVWINYIVVLILYIIKYLIMIKCNIMYWFFLLNLYKQINKTNNINYKLNYLIIFFVTFLFNIFYLRITNYKRKKFIVFIRLHFLPIKYIVLAFSFKTIYSSTFIHKPLT